MWGYNESWRIIVLGSILEPLAHPKPGGVTRCLSHRDKSIFDYAISSYYLARACEKAIVGECRGFMARGIRTYLPLIRSRGNLQVGTLMLLLPLCRASKNIVKLRDLLQSATRLLYECDSKDSVVAYYTALRESRIGHMGEYEGPIPSIFSGKYPDGLVEALEATKWDLVHSELLSGYPITLETVEIILSKIDSGIEEAILWGLLSILSKYGDTLIARKWGWRAYKIALQDARIALNLARKTGITSAMKYLDKLWRPGGWNPGAALDITAVASGLALAVKANSLIEG